MAIPHPVCRLHPPYLRYAVSAPVISRIVTILFLATAACRAQNATTFDVHTFGAAGDGVTLDTKAVQTAIDKCSAAGGGAVLVSKGQFVVGTIYLKSDVTLHIDPGAVILGSTNIADYTTDTDRTMYNEPYMNRVLFFAKDAKNISIEGAGMIDGRGKSFPNKGDHDRNRPKMFRWLNCSNLKMRDVKLQFPASWTTEWRYCDGIDISGITIFSRTISNGDGLDFDGCTNIRVTNSHFENGDDCMCLQTSMPDKPCKNVFIADCSFSGRWSGIRIGLLSRGDFKDVVMKDCVFENLNDSGLKIQENEGGVMDNFQFTGLKMTNVPRPLFLTFCQKNAWYAAPPDQLPPMKSVGNMHFEDITVDDSASTRNSGFVMVGMPGHPVENLSFKNIHAMFPGGGTAAEAGGVVQDLTPENLGNRWPEMGNLRTVNPAHGLLADHVKGLSLEDVELKTKTLDARPAVVFLDVSQVQQSNMIPHK